MDHRCKRCARKLHASDDQPVRQTRGALAVDYDRRPQAAREPEINGGPVQQPLFHGQAAAREPLRLVRMPERGAAPKAHSYRRPGPRQDQPSLDFPQPPAPAVNEEQIASGSAQVAPRMHRFIAASLDAGMVAIGLGLMVIALYFLEVPMTFGKAALPYAGAAIVVSALLYRLLWCLADTDSIGMRWAGLTLRNFDRLRPTRAERLRRLAAASISWAAAGLGLAWALVDEEHLTWHDHMSKTFPSPKRRVAEPRAR